MESVTRLSSDQTKSPWRQNSTGSIITMSSGGSGDSFDSSSGSSHLDQIPYLNYRSSRYYQLIDDLAIIDEIYQTFEGDLESEPYGKYYHCNKRYPILIVYYRKTSCGHCKKCSSKKALC